MHQYKIYMELYHKVSILSYLSLGVFFFEISGVSYGTFSQGQYFSDDVITLPITSPDL